MPGYVNVSGTQKEVKSISANVNGTWKDVSAGYVNVNGTWKQFWPSGWIYGVRITIGESNPSTAVVYTDDCAGWTPMSMSGTTFSAGSWTTSNRMLANIFPVMFDGTTVTKLKKTNLAQDENGNAVSSTVDKFTQINHMWLDIHNDGTYIYVRISDHQEDSNFSDWYFSYNGTVQDCMRIGCYLAYNSGSDSYSRTDVAPTASVGLRDFITYIQNRGTGYDMFRWNQLIFVQALYLILFKSLNSQSALGLGYTSGSSAVVTGANNSLVNEFGMHGSTSSGTVHVSFLWIEDLWGNLSQYIGAMCSNSSQNLLVSDKSSISTTGWAEVSTGISSYLYNIIETVQGTAMGGFCAKSAEVWNPYTYYCDYTTIDNEPSHRYPYFGGRWSMGSNAGIFCLYIAANESDGGSAIGSRISYSGA